MLCTGPVQEGYAVIFLETERLTLRNLLPQDAETMFDYRNNEICARYQRGQTRDQEGIVQLIARRGSDMLSADAPCMVAVALKATGEIQKQQTAAEVKANSQTWLNNLQSAAYENAVSRGTALYEAEQQRLADAAALQKQLEWQNQQAELKAQQGRAERERQYRISAVNNRLKQMGNGEGMDRKKVNYILDSTAGMDDMAYDLLVENGLVDTYVEMYNSIYNKDEFMDRRLKGELRNFATYEEYFDWARKQMEE